MFLLLTWTSKCYPGNYTITANVLSFTKTFPFLIDIFHPISQSLLQVKLEKGWKFKWNQKVAVTVTLQWGLSYLCFYLIYSMHLNLYLFPLESQISHKLSVKLKELSILLLVSDRSQMIKMHLVLLNLPLTALLHESGMTSINK